MSNIDPTFRGYNESMEIWYINACSIRAVWDKSQIFFPPGHVWVEEKDYKLFGSYVEKQALTCCSYRVGWVNELGPDKVPEGKDYVIDFYASKGRNAFKLTIHGVQGGSVLRPSIGLYNPLIKPKEWTWFTPEKFTGEWGIQCTTPDYTLPTGLSVTLNRGQRPRNGTRGWTIIAFRLDNVFRGGHWSDRPVAGTRQRSAPQEVLSKRQ